MNTNSNNPIEIAKQVQQEKKADIKREPIDCGHFNIRIGRSGKWYYLGSEIRRPEIVKLFASVLKRDEEGDYWLETPVQKGRIDVEDVPFVAIGLDISGNGKSQKLNFKTNIGETVTASYEHNIWIETEQISGKPSPYIHIRNGLYALMSRPVYYQLADLAVYRSKDNILGVWSSGVFFELAEAEEEVNN
ncbi:MAG: DUF1285 domain-containing protein [Alphaproteobacteria bacterium]|nr:DUF1285 domain-containing protein [Alphaproteobacteria bacterium]